MYEISGVMDWNW